MLIIEVTRKRWIPETSAEWNQKECGSSFDGGGHGEFLCVYGDFERCVEHTQEMVENKVYAPAT